VISTLSLFLSIGGPALEMQISLSTPPFLPFSQDSISALVMIFSLRDRRQSRPDPLFVVARGTFNPCDFTLLSFRGHFLPWPVPKGEPDRAPLPPLFFDLIPGASEMLMFLRSL